MLKAVDIFQGIAAEVSPGLAGMDQAQMEAAVSAIMEAGQVFVAGMGRSGYMMRCMAMRLMQMGLNVSMVGDTCASCACPGDLLIIGSGSGETDSLKNFAARAHKLGCRVLVMTAHPGSSLGRAADVLVTLPTDGAPHRTPDGAIIVSETGNSGTRMLLGSRLELCMLLTGEALCMMVFHEKGVGEADMMRRHACFE